MSQRVQGKVALVTGAASRVGIGWSIAHLLAHEGAKVVVTDLRAEGVAECAESIQRSGGQAVGLVQDITTEESWRQVVDVALKEFGRIDVLVNNAGQSFLYPIEQTSPAAFRHQIEVNLVGAYLGCAAVIRVMRAQGGGGSLINIASLVGIVGSHSSAAYGASKGGLGSMSKCLAVELGPERIRCNSVHPGAIESDMQTKVTSTNPDYLRQIIESVPLKMMGKPTDVANCVVYLASEESRYITGCEFVVDGGLNAKL